MTSLIFKTKTMEQSKLIVLIRTFSKEELQELYDFVHTPFFNKKPFVPDLYDLIYDESPHFSKLEKEQLWKQIFPQKAYNDIRMRRLMADLLGVCKEYIAWRKFDQDQRTQHLYQLQYFREKQLDKHFNTSRRNIEKWQEQHPRQDIWHYYHQYRLEREIGMSIAQQRKRTADPNLQVLSNHLDAFYLINKLKACCYILNYQTLNLVEYDLPLLEEILLHLQKKTYHHIPIIDFYYCVLQSLLEKENTSYFQRLKNILVENLQLFTKEEINEMFTFARNYCIKRANQGDTAYLTELLELYQLEIENGLLLNAEGKLSPFTYKNIVTLGIRSKRYEWTQTFIEQNKAVLAKEFQDSSYAFNLARLYFQQSEFEKIIPLLNEMEYREIFIELSAKNLLMKTYYELEEFEVLHSFLDSFQMFIRRKKKTLGYHCTSYLNLIKATRQLMRLHYGKQEAVAPFKEKMTSIKEIVDKQWILEKVALLEKVA